MSNLDDQTNEMLRRGLVNTPPDFRDSVMQGIARFEREHPVVSAKNQSEPCVPWWQWAVLTVGSVIGGGQVVRFIFSVWFVSSAAY